MQRGDVFLGSEDSLRAWTWFKVEGTERLVPSQFPSKGYFPDPVSVYQIRDLSCRPLMAIHPGRLGEVRGNTEAVAEGDDP